MNTSKHWTTYWSEGHKTSFGSHFSDLYSGDIKDFWLKEFKATLIGGEVLDLCTGNASLIRLAIQGVEHSEEINFTGIDYAEVAVEEELTSKSNIKLIFNTNVEKLPSQDKEFDLVVSNYGIEYANLDKVIAETDRVLKVGGSLIFVVHSHDSHIVKLNTRELEFIDALQVNEGVLDSLNSMVLSIENKDISIEDKEQCRTKLNIALGSISSLYSDMIETTEFSSFLRFLLKKDTTDKQIHLNNYKDSLTHHRERLMSLVSAALSEEQLAALQEKLECMGYSCCDFSPLTTKRDGVIGHIIKYKK